LHELQKYTIINEPFEKKRQRLLSPFVIFYNKRDY